MKNSDKAFELKKQRIIKGGQTALSKYQKHQNIDPKNVDIRRLKIQTAHPLLRIVVGGLGTTALVYGIWGILSEWDTAPIIFLLITGAIFTILGIRGRKRELENVVEGTLDGGLELLGQIIKGIIEGV